MFDSYYYCVHAYSEKPQGGRVKVHDLTPTGITFSAPPEFGGKPGMWTPEYFFLSAVGSCFISTFEAIARASEFLFSSLETATEGIVEKIDGRFRFSSITINGTLSVESEEDKVLATKLLSKAERSCLVANSLSAPVVFAVQIAVAKPFEDTVRSVP